MLLRTILASAAIAVIGFLAGTQYGRWSVSAPHAIPASETAPAIPSTSVASDQPGAEATSDPSAPAFRDLAVPRKAPLAGLDDRIRLALREWNVPGCAVGIVKDGQVVYLKGFGVRKLGEAAAVDPQTQFGLASVTKSFTATLAAMLVDEGQVDWDAPVARYLPEFTLHEPLSTQQVTLRDLLSHRTGLPRRDELWVRTPLDRAGVLAQVAKVRPKWDLRSRFGYQNMLYLAAGEALGQAAGSNWDDLIRTRILEPLGMQRTTASSQCLLPSRGDSGGPPPNVAAGHDDAKGSLAATTAHNLDNCGPATSMVSCAADMVHWVQFLLADGVWQDKRLVSREALEATMTPTTVILPIDSLARMFPESKSLAYGLGWITLEYREHRVFLHPGNANGQRALVALLPDLDLGLVVLANRELSPLPAAVMYDVFDAYLGPLPKDRVAARQAALRALPEAVAHSRRAWGLANSGKLAEARAEYDQALRLDPLAPLAWHGRGALRARLRDYAGAIGDYTVGLKLDPRDARLLSDRAVARTNVRDAKGALADATAAIALDPDLAEAYSHRAIARRMQHDWPGMETDASRALELNPKLAGAWALRGLARLAQGQDEAAAADFAESLKLAPGMQEMIERESEAVRAERK